MGINWSIELSHSLRQLGWLYQAIQENRSTRRNRDPCTFFCAALYLLRTGIPWRDLPNCYGTWHTIYTRFNKDLCVIEGLLEE